MEIITVTRLATDLVALAYDPTNRRADDHARPTYDQYTRPWTIVAGTRVIVRDRFREMVAIDVVGGSRYVADVAAYEAATSR